MPQASNRQDVDLHDFVEQEDQRSFMSKLTARLASSKVKKAPGINVREALLLLQNYEETRQGWFWSTDEMGRLTYLTESMSQILGKGPTELLGTPFVDLFSYGEDDGSRQRSLPFILAKKTKFTELELHSTLLGEERWWSVSGRPQMDGAGNFLGYRGSGIDITAQRRATQDTSRLAMYDSLTGLATRHRIAKILTQTLVAFKHQRRTCAVMMIDLDRFKQVNDTLGHPAGDTLLKQVAERLSKVIGKRGEVGRLGGDEFQIILPDCDDRGLLGELAADIISRLSHPYSLDGNRCVIGASIGIATCPYDGMTSEELVRNADLALYSAKENGRNRFAFFSSDLHQSADDRRLLEEYLRDALTNGQLQMLYQPIVHARDNHVSGFEALMRWEHPERGYISPAQFIPIAEEARLIGQLGEWALRQACEDAAKWPGQLRVAVNVSPIQFANENLPAAVIGALAASGLAPERLELEITENVFLGETHETEAMFSALKKIGVRLALDDFGTGYSSLGYLKSAPFDKIKIDQSFVRCATEPGSRNGAIIAAIVALADALGMETTAEGIETLDQLDLIRQLNVSHVQGFVYSRAVSFREVASRVETGEWIITPDGPARQRCERRSMFRSVSAIHGNHRYPVVIRNLSKTGALIEGLIDVPVGTEFVIDLGEGQLAMATVRRSMQHQQGVKFEVPLVSDGNGGLCTRHRVSPYLLAAANTPSTDLPPGFYRTADGDKRPIGLPVFSTVSDWKGKLENKG